MGDLSSSEWLALCKLYISVIKLVHKCRDNYFTYNITSLVFIKRIIFRSTLMSRTCFGTSRSLHGPRQATRKCTRLFGLALKL